MGGPLEDNNMKRTQENDILEYFQSGSRLTTMGAIRKFGATRLAGVVKNLQLKHNILFSRRRIAVRSRYGKTNVTQYWLENEANT